MSLKMIFLLVNTFLCLAHFISFNAVFKLVSIESAAAWANFDIIPVNTAGNTGQNIILNCSLIDDTKSLLEWIEFISTPDGRRISINNVVQHSDKQKYRIDGEYNLIIYNVSLTDVGTYACYDDWTNSYAYAELLLIENESICRGESLTIVEGDSFILCGAKGAGAWPPGINVTFLDVKQDYSVILNDTSNDAFVINFSVTANRSLNSAILDYTCDTYFPAPTLQNDTKNRHYSRMAPNFTDSCNESLLMDVQYFSGNLFFEVNGSIYPADSNVTLIANIPYEVTCISDANPQVNCSIIEPNCIGGEEGIKGCSLIVKGMEGAETCSLSCRVTNIIETFIGSINLLFVSL